MPHYRDWFAAAASKAIVHPQFQEAAKAIVPPQFQPEAGRAIVHPQFQPEADGFMKLGDIKGEFSPSREVDGISNQQAQLRNGIRDVDVGAEMLLPDTVNRALGGTAGPGGTTFSTGEGGDSLTDAGLGNNSFNQGAGLHDSVHCIVGGTMCSAVSKDADALVQQGHDFAGLINPDSMRPAEFFSHNPEWFAPGSAVESLVSNSNQMFSPISGEGVFAQRDGLGATASLIVGDNHF